MKYKNMILCMGSNSIRIFNIEEGLLHHLSRKILVVLPVTEDIIKIRLIDEEVRTPDGFGNTTKCSVCESVNHRDTACPDGQYFTEVLPEHEYTDNELRFFSLT